MIGVRVVTASNPGPFTLAGTCTYVVGESQVALIDPGPELPDHLESLVDLVSGAASVLILLTHAHPDHAGGASPLSSRLDAPVFGPGGQTPISDGDRFATDAGRLIALSTPGHSKDHFCYHVPSHGWAFVGDLLLGTGNTTWIGEYPGGVADYFDSLDRLEGIDPQVLYPGHGPAIEDPGPRIESFRRHRMDRIDQVSRALQGRAGAPVEDIVTAVYGELPDSIFPAARSSVEAILDYLRRDR